MFFLLSFGYIVHGLIFGGKLHLVKSVSAFVFLGEKVWEWFSNKGFPNVCFYIDFSLYNNLFVICMISFNTHWVQSIIEFVYQSEFVVFRMGNHICIN